jgi:membrane protein implicated in regulation of membrane protease activity
MTTKPNTRPSIGIVEGTSAALAGGGAITFAFFPLAIPIVALTALAAAPLLLPLLAAGLIAAIVGAPVLLVRRLRQRRRLKHGEPTSAASASEVGVTPDRQLLVGRSA